MATSIFAGSVNNNQEQDNPSRLSISNNNFRKVLTSRNLYNQFSEYPLEDTTIQGVVNSVSSVLDIVAPFKSFDLSNSAFARLITSPSTPLSDIGLIMLGKQFAFNFQSNLAQQTFPQLNVSNLFDGDPNSKLFTSPKNYSITKKPTGRSFEEFLDDFFGINFNKNNPFADNPTNSEYLRNTGSAQLENLIGGINKNIYKTNDPVYFEISDEIKIPIHDRVNLIGSNNRVFYSSMVDVKFNPYLDISPSILQSIDEANKEMQNAYIETSSDPESGQEYAPNLDFVSTYMGQTKKRVFDEDINRETGFNEDIDNQIIWGRDGISEKTNNRLRSFRGLEDDQITSNDDLNTKFNVRIGLLEYTRNLLNATQGRYVDQTRKRFQKNGNDKPGYNGSGLWEAPDNSLFQGMTGVRQHSVLDQYNRFAKAIRFDGNSVYNGNEDSVIYKSVIPRIHPTIDEETGGLNNKNLMFSIENLAVRVIDSGDFGIIDDDFGTQIPKSEIGPFNGRMMWFPPYGIELNETSTAKFDPTVMVGRSEPIYSYMYSERSVTLEFKMIVDYPPQLKDSFIKRDHKTVADFFAFGGFDESKNDIVKNPSKKESDNNKRINEIQGPTERIPRQITLPSDIEVSFPNNMPDEGEINTIIDKMYKDYKYEIFRGVDKQGNDNYGLNSDFYFVTGLTGNTVTGFDVIVPDDFSQYNYDGVRSDLDQAIFDVFNDEETRISYNIDIVGAASKLFLGSNESEYNLALGLRRANAVKYYIEQRIIKIFGDSAEDLGISISVRSVGSNNASDDNAQEDDIASLATRLERTVNISFEKTGIAPDKKEKELSPEDRQAIRTLINEKQTLQGVEHKQKRNGGNFDSVYKERGSSNIEANDAGMLKGFKSVIDNYFYPGFHSQTPEDFHKRLTFLQQCTRQGSSIKTNPVVENGVERAKNSVFGRQPICILRVGDFFYTKVIIETVTIDYTDTTWDMNPEGFGMQPMIASVTLQMKVLGGQSLKGPIDALQNAVSFNYYANSNFTSTGTYKTPSTVADRQNSYIQGVLTEEQTRLRENFRTRLENNNIDNIYQYNVNDFE